MKKAPALLILILLLTTAKTQTIQTGSSSGWIPFQLSLNQICFPVQVNGHHATARLFNAVGSAVDKDFAATLSLAPADKVTVNIQLGAWQLPSPVIAGLFAHAAATPPNDIRLGEEVFKQCIVDIDFANHAIAFYKPGTFTSPASAVSLPFNQHGDDRAVEIKVEAAPALYYWVYLGDPAPLSVYANVFAPQGMLSNRPVSVRQGGGPRRPPEAVATVSRMQLAGVSLQQIPAVLPHDSVTGAHPADVGGHIGIATLSRFRVIFDYGQNRIYFIPASAQVVNAPFAKDRSGLVLRKIGEDYVVTFVCPGSPAFKTGFKLGDTVTQVNHQPMPALQGIAWQTAAWSSVLPTEPGKTYLFTLKDGSVGKLTTGEFF